MIEFILFFLGIQLMMTFIAACYRIVDLWYRIGDFVVPVVIRIAIPGLLIAVILYALQGGYLRAFQAGLAAFATFHVAVFWLGQLIVTLRRS